MLQDAKTEIAKSDELWNDSNLKALREQQEKAFGYFGPYEYKMDKKEGDWEEVTTNTPKTIANKVLGLLATSWVQLFINVDDETREKRKSISKSEQLANGAIWANDRSATTVPSGKSSQEALSFHALIRGGTAQSFLWVEKDGLAVPKGRNYDPEFCQWEEGDEELVWFCFRNYVNRAYIKRTYKDKADEIIKASEATPSLNKGVLTYTFWDEDTWRVAIGDKYVETVQHNLGYIPVNVKSTGSVPYVQSDGTYSDTIRWAWVNIFGNNWDIFDLQSRLLSVLSSKATEAGKIKAVVEFDGTKSGGKVPEEAAKLGYSEGGRNEMVFLDIAKGQKFIQTVEPPSNQQILELYQLIRGLDILSSIDPIAFGQMTRSGSGRLAAELRAAALEFIYPFKKCVEESLVWRAEECVRQFKNGNFSKTTVEGIDYKKQKFYLENIKPSEVEEKHFECHLIPDRLRDKIQEAGLAIQLVSAGLMSRRTAMLEHNIVADPDKEMELIENEKHADMAGKDPVMHNQALALWYKDKGNEEMSLYHSELAKKAIEMTILGMMGGNGQGEMRPGSRKPPMGLPLTPQAEVGGVMAEDRQL